MEKRAWSLPQKVVAVVVVLLAACVFAFSLYVGDYYVAADDAFAAAQEAGVAVSEDDAAIAVGSAEADVGLVLYSGAKVEPAAYVPLAADFAERGVYCVIAKMPFNLAIFGVDSAQALMDEAPQVERWWVGGHSLGGSMAAQFAAGHAEELDGVLLLAAYSTADLSNSGLEALVAYGSEDGVLNRDNLAANEGNLPASTETLVIEGGNHAGFGAYGPQEGDGEATVSAESQQAQTVDAAVALMR